MLIPSAGIKRNPEEQQLLLEDINKKAVQVDPAVQAIADLGQSVSDVNQASRSLVENLASRREKRRNSFMKSAAQAAAMKLLAGSLSAEESVGGRRMARKF